MIPLAVPNLTGKEHEYVAQALASGHIGPDGPFVERFEAMVAKAAGRKWAVATITGTAALHLAVRALHDGWKPPVHALLNSRAFPALRNVLLVERFRVDYVDGDFNHDVEAWGSIADRAPAIGEPPTDAILECYSFAANKTVTCGQGGAVVGDDAGREAQVRTLIRQGYDRSGLFNYRMADINAAIGCAQMERLDELRAAKRRIWERYRGAGLPMVERGASRWMSTIAAPASLVARLRARGIEARAEPAGVSIPCSTGLTEADQDVVIRAVLEELCAASA